MNLDYLNIQNIDCRQLNQYIMRSALVLATVMTILLTASADNNSRSGVEYQTRPPVTETLLFTIGNSPADGRLIASTYELQFLQLSHFPNPTNTSMNLTAFDLTILDRTAPGHKSSFNFTYPGTWTHVQSSPLTLSCNIVFEESMQYVGLVLWNKTDKSFRMVTALPVGLLSGGNNVTAAEMRQLMHVGENCQLMSYTLGPLYYVFTAINNYTQQVIVTTPSSGGVNYTIQAYSADLIYSIWNNSLYRYDSATTSYLSIFDLGSFNKFSIKSRGDRIVVAAANTQNLPGGYVQANYTLFVLEYFNGSATLVDNFTINGVMELANGTGFFLFVSPRLTKLGIVYVNATFNLTVVAKHINYRQQNATSLYFQNLNRIKDTVAIIDYVKEFSMSDQFIVVKNISLYNSSSSSAYPQFQFTFQMVGSQIVYLGGRNLHNNSRERANFLYVFIDNSVTYNCYVINVYSLNATSYEVVQFNYGNLASNYRVVDPPGPPLISFTRPMGMEYSYDNNFQYLYSSPMNTTTLLTAVWPTYSAGRNSHNSSGRNFNYSGTNYGMANITLNGSWQVRDYNRDCFALQMGVAELRVYRINRTAMGWGIGIELVQSFTSFSGVTLSNTTKVNVSGNCWMLRVDSNIYSNQNGSFVQVTTTGLSWSAIDNTLTLLILTNNSIARYDPAANSYTSLMNHTATLTASTTIRSFWPNASRIVLMDVSNSSLWMDLLTWSNGQYVSVFSYSRGGFVAAPTVEISRRNQSKVLIVGELAGDNTSLVQAFNLNYTSLSYQNISFARNPPANTSNYYYISESFVFFRINAYTWNLNARETVYFLSGGLYPREIFNSDRDRESGSDDDGDDGDNDNSQNDNDNSQNDSSNNENESSNDSESDSGYRNESRNGSEYRNGSRNDSDSDYWDSNCSHRHNRSWHGNCSWNQSGNHSWNHNHSITRVVWVKAIIIEHSPSRASLLSQTRHIRNGRVVVNINAIELWANEANYDHGDENYVVDVDNGTIHICPPGCMNCQCTRCFPGFFKAAGSSVCQACAPGCLTCNEADISICGSCQVGLFLNSTSNCESCASACIECSDSASNCTRCPPGQYSSSGNCSSCPANCFNCSNGTVCTLCQQGFVVDSTGSCIACALYCSKCNASNITQCTRCGLGLQMVAGECQQCPSNCLECTGSRCDICSAGYMPNNNGVCVLKCELPCTSCVQNSPTVCTGCQLGAFLANNTCHIDLSCNANSTCLFCPVGFNYFLVTASNTSTCQPCPSILNCIQCSRVDSYRCALCQRGYFSNSTGKCQVCHSTCLTCRSGVTCTQCQPGYTLVSGLSESACLACVSPCATCIGSPNNCVSCIANFTKQGWSCRNDSGFTFSFVVNEVLANVLANIGPIQRGCLQALGSSNARNLVFQRIYSGSTIIAGSAQVSNGSVTQAAQTFSQTISNGIPGTNLTASSVTVQQNRAGGTVEESSESSTGIILGVVCGILIVIVIVTIVCVAVRKRSEEKTAGEVPPNEVVIEQTPYGGSSKDHQPLRNTRSQGSASSLQSEILYPSLSDGKVQNAPYYDKDI